MKQFTIIEEKWARGGINGRSALLNDQGSMCCLGFLCESEGVSKSRLMNVALPSAISNLPETLSRLTAWAGKVGQRRPQDRIATINDDRTLQDGERKGKLARLFAELGYEIQYV